MRASGLVLAVSIGILGLTTALTAGSGPAECAVLTSGERATCLTEWIESARSLRDLRPLQALAAEVPDLALEVVALRAAGGVGRTGAEFDAAYLDVRAEALATQGNAADALAIRLEALSIDDGSVRLERLGSDGEAIWSTAVAAGTGRQIRAATALAAAGQGAEALSLARRVYELGGAVEAQELLVAEGAEPVEPQPLSAPRWFPPFPQVELPLVDGSSMTLPPPAAEVLIVDFWATWCPPCVEELPRLERLQEKLREDGLVVVTVNMGEENDVASEFLEGLGVTLPAGRYGGKLRDLLHVEELPTVIVVDRQSRIRAQWSGYEDGVMGDIGQAARDLLDPDLLELFDTVGSVRLGSESLEVLWSRETLADVDGVAVLPEAGGATLRTVNGRRWVSYGREGEMLDNQPSTFAANVLRVGDLGRDPAPTIVGYRRGGTRLVIFDVDGAEHQSLEAPAPLFDVAFRPSVAGQPDEMLLGTTDGLFARDAAGAMRRIEGFAAVYGILTAASADLSTFVVESGNRLVTVDDDLRPGPVRQLEAGVRPLGLAARDAVVAARGGGAVVAFGSFLGGRAGIAVAAQEQLTLIDAATGQAVVRASWPEIRALAAGDLDGDGADELVVASRRRLTVVRAGESGLTRGDE